MALLLVLTMLLGMVPSASAVDAGAQAPGATAAAPDKRGGTSANGTPAAPETEDSEGSDDYSSVTITPAEDPGTDLMDPDQDSDVIEETKHAPGEIVRVIVTFDRPALLDTYSAYDLTNNISVIANEANKIDAWQGDILSDIEAAVDKAMETIPMPMANGPVMKTNYRYATLFNGASISIPYGAIPAVQEVDGVASAFMAEVYDVPEDMGNTANPYTYSSTGLIGAVQTWNTAGYTGDGMRVAVIDTGLDIDHPSFSDEGFYPKDPLTISEISAALGSLHITKDYSASISAEKLYFSRKVPFGFCYVDNDTDITHDTDMQGDHGTHVAGIIAANKTDGTDVIGVAPDAQLLIMKVFGDNGGAYQDDIAAALEDCFYLGVDSVNMSLGSNAGFSQSSMDWERDIYDRVAENGIILAVAAGNSTSAALGNPRTQYHNETSDPDNGLMSSPATYSGVTAVASSENAKFMAPYFEVNGKRIFYNDVALYPFNELASAGELKYVVIPGAGVQSDYDTVAEQIESIGFDPWIALVRRGDLDFTAKQVYAIRNDATAIIVYDSVEGTMLNMMDAEVCPNVFITKADGEYMISQASNSVGTLTVSYESAVSDSPDAGKMSSFSSWGPSPDLTLTPDITAPGGRIYSTINDGQYGEMSGTSMATPQVAGMAALVLQYLDAKYPSLSKLERHNLAEALLMSTATPLTEENVNGEKTLYSPRLQGAGLANVYNAVTTPAYLTVSVPGSNETSPKASLGESTIGSYSFTFTLHNLSNESLTYRLDSSLLTDQAQQEVDQLTNEPLLCMSETSRSLYTHATFSTGDIVTVGPQSSTDITVYINLSSADTSYMSANYPNGIYVDGFIRLVPQNTDTVGVSLGLPFCGFYGDWSAAPMFDTGFWYEDEPVYNRYLHVVLDEAGMALGLNPYTESPYNAAHNIMSPNGDGFFDAVADIYVPLMRNAKELIFTWSRNANGSGVLYQAVYDQANKSVYNSSFGIAIPTQYSTLVESGIAENYGFWDEDGNILPEGTTLYLTVAGKLDDGDDIVDESYTVPITIDLTAPELDTASMKLVDGPDGKKDLQVTVSDNTYVAAVMPLTGTGTPAAYYTVSDPLSHGPDSVTIDLAGLDAVFQIAVGDFGGNESYYTVTLNKEPELASDQWYAYRYKTWLDTGYGYQQDGSWYNGWWSFDANDRQSGVNRDITANTEAEDFTAAEYVDGFIFGITESGEISAIREGSWNRSYVGDLVYDDTYYSAVDMAFDHANKQLYVLTEADEEDKQFLLTLDPNSGLVSAAVAVSGSDTELLTLAASNEGVLYTVDTDAKSATLYSLNASDGKLTKIGATGLPTGILRTSWDYDYETEESIEVTSLEGYRQTMAVDHTTDQLYWYYYLVGENPTTHQSIDYSDLVTVNTATGKATHVPDAFDPYAETALGESYEYVGLFKPYRKDAIIEKVPAEALELSESEIYLQKGNELLLTAITSPFNADISALTWTSSNANVASVDSGVVTARNPGTAVITAKLGALTATCTVIVKDVNADLRVFEGASSYHYLKFEAADPTKAAVMKDSISPAFAITAAAYHNGKVYAYDGGGSFYVLDPATMNGTKIGSCGELITALALNYKDGTFYGIKQETVGSMWEQQTIYTLVKVNPNSGAIEDICEIDALALGQPCLGMAIDPDGVFYFAVMSDMYSADVVKASLSGGEITELDRSTVMPVVTGSSNGSMVYSPANDALFWCNDVGQVIYIDPETMSTIYLGGLLSLELSGFSLNMGLVEIPATEPAVPKVAAQEAAVDEVYLVMQGGKNMIPVDMNPWNATSKVTYTVSDPTIATVGADGTITGVKPGATTVTITVEGLPALTTTVKVFPSGAELYGMAVSDLAGDPYNYWISFPDLTPYVEPDVLDQKLNNTEFTVFAGTEYQGTIYAFLQGDESYDYDNYITTFDENFKMTVVAPCHYNVMDMAIDYRTGALYAVCNGGTHTGALLQIDKNTGDAYVIGDTGIGMIACTFDANGTLYAISTDSDLYTIDISTGKATLVGATGLGASTGLQSMTCDLDTGNIYWHHFNNGENAEGYLCLVDPETGTALELGTVYEGMMVTSLFTDPERESEPAETALPSAVVLVEDRATTAVGGTLQLTAVAIPVGAESTIDRTLTWTSSDTSIAVVNDGLVIGLKAGTVVITVTDAAGHTDTCTVTVTDGARALFAYDQTNGQWLSYVTGKPETVRADADGEVRLQASVYVEELDKIYAYGENGDFFEIDPETFERTKIGAYDFGIYSDWDGEMPIVPVDMSWSDGELYVAANAMQVTEDGYYGADSYLYRVNLEDGSCELIYEATMATSEPVFFGNLYVANGKAYTIDAYDTGMLTSLDLETLAPAKLAMVNGYWSEPTSSRSFFLDEASNTLYIVRDFAGGGLYGNGTDPDPVLYIFNLNDAGLTEVSIDLGDHAVLHGLFFRETGSSTGELSVQNPEISIDPALENRLTEEQKATVNEIKDALAKTASDGGQMLAAVLRDLGGELPEVSREEAVKLLQEKNITVSDDDEIRTVVETALKIELTDYAEEGDRSVLTFNVDLIYRILVTTAATNDDIDETNSAELAAPKTVNVNTSFTFTITLPASFLKGATFVYVRHENDLEQRVPVASDGTVTIVSKNGLSPFTVSTTTNGEVRIGDTIYDTLEDALRAVQDGETIVLLKDIVRVAPVTVSRTVSFTLDADGHRFEAHLVAGYGYVCIYDPITGQYQFYREPDYNIPENPTAYPVIITDSPYGTVTPSVSSARAGAKVVITVTPASGYAIDTIVVKDGYGNVLKVTNEGNNQYSFVMPASSATVLVTFYRLSTPGTTPGTPSAPRYNVNVDPLEHGKVTVSESRSEAGEEITITVTPDKGYELVGVVVQDSSGKEIAVTAKGDDKYTFKMPASAVTVTVTLRKCPSLQFTDLDTSLWYHNAIDYMLEHKLMSGTSDTLFAPSLTTDRAMLTTILYNLEGRPAVEEASTFEDVAAGKWYADAIAWAQDNAVVAGTGANTFAPDTKITREQMAVMLYNYVLFKGYDVTKAGDLTKFADADSVSSWAEKALCWATANGLISGVSSDPTVLILNPKGESTRSEMAALMMNFLEKLTPPEKG